jgi:hypothetical protein
MVQYKPGYIYWGFVSHSVFSFSFEIGASTVSKDFKAPRSPFFGWIAGSKIAGIFGVQPKHLTRLKGGTQLRFCARTGWC